MADDLARSILQMAIHQREKDSEHVKNAQKERDQAEMDRTRMRIQFDSSVYVTSQMGNSYFSPRKTHIDFARDTQGRLRLKTQMTREVVCTEKAFPIAVRAMLSWVRQSPGPHTELNCRHADIRLFRGHQTHTGRWSYVGEAIMMHTVQNPCADASDFDWFEIERAIHTLYEFAMMVED